MLHMTSSRTILKNLKSITEYLNQFPNWQRSTHFEKLVAEAFSHILYLPFYASDNDDDSIPHRVIWRGKVNPVSKAPGRGPDAIARCYHFCLIIEATRKPGSDQWSREFAQSIRHCKDFCSKEGVQPNNVYVLIVCLNLHEDTYKSIKANPKQEYRLTPIGLIDLAIVLETSILAFTMRHLELRQLLNQITDCIRTSSSLDDFRNAEDNLLKNWQKDVLKVEKNAFLGVKSYEAMRRISRTHIGASEILRRLQRHRTLNKYLKIIGEKLSLDIIEESLIQQSLASQLSPTYDGERLFSPVLFTDFKERELRLIKAVEEVNG
jgi:hypothetical protein